MEQLQLRVRLVPRAVTDERDELDVLVDLVQGAVRAGGGGPVAVVVRADRFDLIELSGLGRLPFPHFVAGLSRSTTEGAAPVEAVGVAGRFQQRRNGGEQPVALAFLEWPDCRWGLWQVLLDGRGAVVPASETRRSALEGDSLPDGLGRWWTLGRRSKMVVQLGPVVRVMPQASQVVH